MPEKQTDPKKKNKPIWEMKIGSVKLFLFKNKNSKGKKYVMWSMCIYRFPFKFNRVISFTESEAEHLLEILQKRPHIQIEQKAS